MKAWLDKRFKLSENGTTVRTELLGGATLLMGLLARYPIAQAPAMG